LSAVILHLGYLLVLAQKDHRGIHDLLSDTCVIYYHEKKVYVHVQMNYRSMTPEPGYIVPPQAQAETDTMASNAMASAATSNDTMASAATADTSAAAPEKQDL
jgi:hypothetical protein